MRTILLVCTYFLAVAALTNAYDVNWELPIVNNNHKSNQIITINNQSGQVFTFNYTSDCTITFNNCSFIGAIFSGSYNNTIAFNSPYNNTIIIFNETDHNMISLNNAENTSFYAINSTYVSTFVGDGNGSSVMYTWTNKSSINFTNTQNFMVWSDTSKNVTVIGESSPLASVLAYGTSYFSGRFTNMTSLNSIIYYSNDTDLALINSNNASLGGYFNNYLTICNASSLGGSFAESNDTQTTNSQNSTCEVIVPVDGGNSGSMLFTNGTTWLVTDETKGGMTTYDSTSNASTSNTSTTNSSAAGGDVKSSGVYRKTMGIFAFGAIVFMYLLGI